MIFQTGNAFKINRFRFSFLPKNNSKMKNGSAISIFTIGMIFQYMLYDTS